MLAACSLEEQMNALLAAAESLTLHQKISMKWAKVEPPVLFLENLL